MFDTLYRAARTATNVATLPLSMAADVATVGGMLTDRDASYTESKTRRIAKDAGRLVEDVAG